MKKLFFVDVNRDIDTNGCTAIVQNLNTDTGTTVFPARIKADCFEELSVKVAEHILREQPDQVIFDHFGVSNEVQDRTMWLLKYYHKIDIDSANRFKWPAPHITFDIKFNQSTAGAYDTICFNNLQGK